MEEIIKSADQQGITIIKSSDASQKIDISRMVKNYKQKVALQQAD